MIKEIFINLTILVSLLFFYSHLSRRNFLKYDSSFKVKTFLGVLGGLLSCVLMEYAIHIDGTLLDLRHVPTILLAFYGGAVPALVSMIVVIIGRFLISADAAFYFSIFINASVTFLSIYIAKLRLTKNIKIFAMVTTNNLLLSIIISFFVSENTSLIKTLIIYWIASYLAAYLAFYTLEYIRESQKLFSKYKMESATDSLTGLHNTRNFHSIFNTLIADLHTNEQKLALLFIDIDFFKEVNDTYGHLEGDIVLKEVGARLKESVRNFDIVCRNGGDEFLALLLDCPIKRAAEIAERIGKNVGEEPFMLSTGKKITITLSIGVSAYPETTIDPSNLIDDADKALYEAKQLGCNRYCRATASE